MKDWLRQAWLFGVGTFFYTKEKVEALVQEMVQRGEISQQESPEIVKQILVKAQDAQQALLGKIKELTQKAIADFNPARAKDLEALEKRVASLEEELKRFRT